jgi:hypothetical protein
MAYSSNMNISIVIRRHTTSAVDTASVNNQRCSPDLFVFQVLTAVTMEETAYSSAQKTEAVRFSAMSVNFYRTARRHIPEDSTFVTEFVSL